MSDNRLIMKNTGFMAIRMLFSMAVTLYTSRVVLQQLGVDDFGLYNVIGGLALIMSFFTSAMTAAIQRYMNVELAVNGGASMQKMFAACWGCVFVMTACFLLVAEIAGIWFIDNELNIVPESLKSAHIVFQISLAIVVIEIIRVPYNSLIIANEKMSFFAYNSIVEVTLKLLTAISLSMVPGYKLYVYMWLLVGVALLINASYVLYCRKHMPGVHFSLHADRKQMAEIGKFAGWNVLTSLSDISYQQGSAMILNIFYGVVMNATMGIANQVKIAVSSFTRSVQTAANPQIVKLFAAGEYDDFATLFMRISRISFYLMLLLGIPIMLNTEYILDLWLDKVPPLGTLFVRLMVLFCIIDSLSGPLWVTMQAAGKIVSYQIVISIMWILCLPLTYMAFRYGLPSYWIILVMIGINALLILIRMAFTSHFCHIRYASYLSGVLWPVSVVTILSLILPLLLTFEITEPLERLLVSCPVWCLTLSVAVYFLGLTKTERTALASFVSKHLKRKP